MSKSIRKFLNFVEPPLDPDNPGGAGTPPAPAFPANTPVKEMSVEEQAAYWKHQARKHEGRVTAYGGLTPEQVKDLQDKAAKQEQDALTEQERAVNAAREEGRAELRKTLGEERAITALERALQGREASPAALLTLDRSQFIDGDRADTAKIAAWVEANTTEASTQRANTAQFQGQRDRNTPSARDLGKQEAARRFPKTT